MLTRLKSAHVDDALAKGATAVCGGSAHDAGPLFYSPTVLVGVTKEMRMASKSR